MAPRRRSDSSGGESSSSTSASAPSPSPRGVRAAALSPAGPSAASKQAAAQWRPSLLSAEEVPHEVATPYVQRYYRPPAGLRGCLASIFAFHNQTLNVWTHLLGTLYFCGAAADAAARLRARSAGAAECAVTALFFAAAIFQMAASAAYHTFGSGVAAGRSTGCCGRGRCCVFPPAASLPPASKGADARHTLFLKLDLLGIVAMIAGSFALGLFHGFVCAPHKSVLYFAAVSLSLGAGAALALVEDACGGSAARRTLQTAVRTGLIAISVIFGAVPVFEWFLTEGVTLPPAVQAVWLRAVAGMFGWYGLGFTFYLTRLPERAAPGRFDVLGASHQIWHACVWAAGAEWAHGLLALGDWRAEQWARGGVCPLAAGARGWGETQGAWWGWR